MSSAMLWGKLPAHGDFVSRGVTAAERDALDEWLAASLADAHAAVVDGFDDRYDAAPPWRFAWRQEDGRWTAGALAPSVDGVGRRYPLLAGLCHLDASAVAGAAAAAEGLIYDALGEGWTADRLFAEADAREVAPGETWTSGSGWWTVDANGTTAARIEGDRPPGLIRTIVMVQGGAWA